MPTLNSVTARDISSLLWSKVFLYKSGLSLKHIEGIVAPSPENETRSDFVLTFYKQNKNHFSDINYVVLQLNHLENLQSYHGFSILNSKDPNFGCGEIYNQKENIARIKSLLNRNCDFNLNVTPVSA